LQVVFLCCKPTTGQQKNLRNKKTASNKMFKAVSENA